VSPPGSTSRASKLSATVVVAARARAAPRGQASEQGDGTHRRNSSETPNSRAAGAADHHPFGGCGRFARSRAEALQAPPALHDLQRVLAGRSGRAPRRAPSRRKRDLAGRRLPGAPVRPLSSRSAATTRRDRAAPPPRPRAGRRCGRGRARTRPAPFPCPQRSARRSRGSGAAPFRGSPGQRTSAVPGEADADSELESEQAPRPCLGLDSADQGAGDAPPAPPRQNREPAQAHAAVGQRPKHHADEGAPGLHAEAPAGRELRPRRVRRLAQRRRGRVGGLGLRGEGRADQRRRLHRVPRRQGADADAERSCRGRFRGRSTHRAASPPANAKPRSKVRANQRLPSARPGPPNPPKSWLLLYVLAMFTCLDGRGASPPCAAASAPSSATDSRWPTSSGTSSASARFPPGRIRRPAWICPNTSNTEPRPCRVTPPRAAPMPSPGSIPAAVLPPLSRRPLVCAVGALPIHPNAAGRQAPGSRPPAPNSGLSPLSAPTSPFVRMPQRRGNCRWRVRARGSPWPGLPSGPRRG
jgi:hypothetical protein